MNLQTWKTIQRLLEEGTATRKEPLGTAFSFHLNSPILVLLQMQAKIMAQFPQEATENLLSYLEEVFGMIDESYFYQLGGNPNHYSHLIDDLSGFHVLLRKAVLLALKFSKSQDKKAGHSFLVDRILPAMKQAPFYRGISEGEKRKIGDRLADLLFVKESPSEMEALLQQIISKDSKASVTDHVQQSLKPSNFYGFFVQSLLAKDACGEFLCLIFSLFTKQFKPQNPRVTLFQLCILLVSVSPTVEYYSGLLRILLESGIYVHKNDEVYTFQTSFLVLMLKEVRGTAFEGPVASLLLNLNFYAVLDELEGSEDFSALKSESFVNALVKKAVDARQLPRIIKVLLKRGLKFTGTNSGPAVDIPKSFMGPIVTELATSIDADPASAFHLAHFLAMHTKEPAELTLLLERAFGHSCEASSRGFILCMLNKLPTLIKVYRGRSTGDSLIDALLNLDKITGSADPSVLVQILPLLQDDSIVVPCIRFLLHQAIMNEQYFQLFRLAPFYESYAVRTCLLPALLDDWKGFAKNPEGLIATLNCFPLELFSGFPHTPALMERLFGLACPDAVKILARIAEVSPPSSELLNAVLQTADKDSARAILDLFVQQHGVGATLRIVDASRLTNGDVLLKAKYLENLADGDRAILGSFLGPLSGTVSFENDIDLIEQMLTACQKVELTDLAEKLRGRALQHLSRLDLHLVSPKLLKICIKSTDNAHELTQFLAYALVGADGQDKEWERCVLLIMEKQSLDDYKETLKFLLDRSSTDPTQILDKCMLLGDKVKVRLAIEASIWMIQNLQTCHSVFSVLMRVVSLKGFRPLKPTEIDRFLLVASAGFDGNEQAALKFLSALQSAYWHVIVQFLPSYIGILTSILIRLPGKPVETVNLYGRLLVEVSEGPSVGLVYALPPLILTFVRVFVEQPYLSLALRSPFFSLFRIFDTPKARKADEDPFARLVRLCQACPDDRVMLIQLSEEYRKEYKYTGKA